MKQCRRTSPAICMGVGMKRRKRKITTIAVIVILGALIGSDLTEEIFVRLNMAIKIPRTLDYYEYHGRGDRDAKLLSMCLYSWQKQGTQRKCREYIPISSVEAVLASYTLEGYDALGNPVYQKELTSEGKKETYWTYIYDEQERLVEKGMWAAGGSTYAEGIPCQLQKYHYYEDGMKVETVYDYPTDIQTGYLESMTFYDMEGQEFLHKIYGYGEEAQELLHQTYGNGEEAQEIDRTTLSLGVYGREELVCEGDILLAYRWYEYTEYGDVSFILEITPEEMDSVQYLCTYTIFDYDDENRLKAAYRYEPVVEEYPDFCTHFRLGDVDTGIAISYDENGRLNGFATAYYMGDDQPGEMLYYVFIYEDGTFELDQY